MNDDQQSSLELLLDTITNAFGGIVFLALLVVMLLQMTTDRARSELPNATTREKLVEAETELEKTIAERNRLLRALTVQEELLGQMATESRREDLEQLRRSRRSRDELNSHSIQLAKKITEQQIDINSLAKILNELDQELKSRETQVKVARQTLAKELQSRTTTARLPRLRATAKIEIPLVLRYGRLYLVHRYSAGLRTRRLNTDIMVIVEEKADEQVATPKPYAGIPIHNDEPTKDTVRNELMIFSPDMVYLAIAVWEDSFGQFIPLKNMVVELGYEYRVLPIEDGGMVFESSDVNPLVQ